MTQKRRMKTLKIVGKKSEAREIGSGALRRDIVAMIEVEVTKDSPDLPPWLDGLIDRIEEQYTPRRPSIRDQVHFMAALAALVSPTPPAGAPKTVNEAMHYLGDPLGLLFAKDLKLKFFPDSPYAGEATCICSFCEEVIEEAPVIRLFEGGLGEGHTTEARLHTDCFRVCSEFGLIPENVTGL